MCARARVRVLGHRRECLQVDAATVTYWRYKSLVNGSESRFVSLDFFFLYRYDLSFVPELNACSQLRITAISNRYIDLIPSSSTSVNFTIRRKGKGNIRTRYLEKLYRNGENKSVVLIKNELAI